MRTNLRRGAAVVAVLATMAGASVWGNVRPVFAAAPLAPGTPTITPSPTTNDGTVVLTWTAPAGSIAYYEVFRYTGSGSAVANEITYLGQTSGAATHYTDSIPTEGTFRYAVLAVDTDGNAGAVSAWQTVTVDLPANGIGVITPDSTAPIPIANLQTSAAFTKGHSVNVSWTASNAPDLERYLVYRQKGTAAATMLGYVTAGTNSFGDTVTDDGSYTYFLRAQDTTGNVSAPSATATTVVDAIAPVVNITNPAAGQSYPASGALTAAATIAETGSGYESTAVKYYMDGAAIASPTFAMNGLTAGTHTFKVEVTDRAGNVGTAQVQFVVGSASNPSAPQNPNGPGSIKDRTITLNWQAPTTGTVTQYLVYRSTGNSAPVVVGATQPNVLTFTDTVTADGAYTYYVVGVTSTGLTPNSVSVTVTVDAVAPVISISAPIEAKVYVNQGTLEIKYTVTDAGGYTPASVKLWLDGTAITGNAINLANLAVGTHTLKLEVTDKAGNVMTKSVTFSLTTAGNGDTPGQPTGHIGDVLASLKSQINNDLYNYLVAKAKNNDFNSFTMAIIKYRGKGITAAAADQLLAVIAADHLLDMKPKPPEKKHDDDKDKKHDKGDDKHGNHDGGDDGDGESDDD